jgi:aminoglycoside phosphotransferase (APT) family kinase protein
VVVVEHDHRRPVLRKVRVVLWHSWADDVLARPAPTVLAHGDFHRDNQIWDHDRLQAVLDFETFGLAAPEYDLCVLPGTGPIVELLSATLRHYRRHFTVRRTRDDLARTCRAQ